MVGSIVPDFDFLPGILIGEPGAFHHGASHSLTSAVIFGVVVFTTLSLWRQKRVAREAGLAVIKVQPAKSDAR